MRAFSPAVLSSIVFFASPALADASDREQCAKSYEAAQRARQAHQLKAARQELLVCSQSQCQGWIKKDCVPWLGQVEAAMPSIVVSAHDPNGKPQDDVRIAIDGAAHAPLESIALDPGEHTLVVSAPNVARIEQKLTLVEGEHDRRVDITLTPAAVALPAPLPPPKPAGRDERPVPALTWVLGGVGVVAAGVGTYFQVSGMSKHSDLEACRGRCTQSDVDTARSTLWTGNIVLGVAVVALVGAAVVYFTRPSAHVSE